jgi:hypothetical protein
MVMGLEGLTHQIHCRFMGAIVGKGFLGHSSPRKNNQVTRKKTHLSLPIVASYFWFSNHVFEILTSKFYHCWSLL